MKSNQDTEPSPVQLKTSIKLLTLPIKCIDAEIGVGVGLGGGTEIALGGGVTFGVSEKISSTISMEYNSGTIDSRSTTSIEYSESILGLDATKEIGKSHSHFDSQCTCKSNYIFSGINCPANQEFVSVENTVGVSGALYLGYGAEYSLGLSVDDYFDQKDEILNEYYTFKESFKLFEEQ